MSATKRNGLILSVALLVMGFATMFAFAGCSVGLKTLSESFSKIDNFYSTNSTVFKTDGTLDSLSSLESCLVVSYGAADTLVSEDDEFKTLKSTYNVMLAISQNYIDTNKDYILNYDTDDNLNSDVKSAINTLNSSIEDYLSVADDFISARSTLVSEVEKLGNATDLISFKKSYGKFVSANIEVALNLAKCIELTKLFDLLKETTTVSAGVKVAKEYIQIKTLSYYSKFLLDDIHNKLAWSNYDDDEDSAIVKLYNAVENSFTTNYIGLVNRRDGFTTFEEGDMKNLLDLADEYFKEAESFEQAVSDFDFYAWATDYECNLDKYAEENEFANIDLNKMNQFVTVTEKFLTKVNDIIY